MGLVILFTICSPYFPINVSKLFIPKSYKNQTMYVDKITVVTATYWLHLHYPFEAFLSKEKVSLLKDAGDQGEYLCI